MTFEIMAGCLIFGRAGRARRATTLAGAPALGVPSPRHCRALRLGLATVVGRGGAGSKGVECPRWTGAARASLQLDARAAQKALVCCLDRLIALSRA